MRTLVVCIGNDLAADDAAGGLVHERLSGAPLPEGVRMIRLGAGGARILDDLDGENLLVVCDAVRFGAPPGTIHRIDRRDLPALESPAASAHGLGFVDALELGRVLFPERLPKRIVLVGIEGARFDPAREPTAEVMDAIGPAAAAVIETIERAQQQSAESDAGRASGTACG